MRIRVIPFIVVVFGVLLVVLVGVLVFVRLNQPSTASAIQSQTTPIHVAPTPLPFQEMTIPYLRQRTYDSKLGIRTEAYQRAAYSAYVTSYISDGLKINGLLTIPKGEMPPGGYPAIVFVHGYIAPSAYRTLERYGDYIDYLSRNGFVVFKIDLRGHGDSEGIPGGAYYAADYVIDTLNAYAALQQSDVVNKSRIGLWGHSMAGNVLMRSFAAKPDIPAVVIWAGAVYTYKDFMEYSLNDTSYRPPQNNSERQRLRQLLFDTHGQFNEQSIFWSQVAVTNYLPDIRGALQMHHASDDTVVRIEYSRNLDRLLDQTTVPHELYEYTGGGHNISGTAWNTAMQRTVEFYKKHL